MSVREGDPFPYLDRERRVDWLNVVVWLIVVPTTSALTGWGLFHLWAWGIR